MNKRLIITACAGLLLSGIALTGILNWQSERRKVEDLESQMSEMKKKVMQSAVDRSVSSQMEAIANEQREISDEKREEALRQTKVANEMRLQSEQERLNAIKAEQNAVASEKKALEASSVAENQRKLAEQQQKLAEHQRIQAEFSKRQADTLSYIALGRSLGSISTIQAQADNDDIANLLSYASYLYTSRYNGDIYYPAVIQSLMLQSQSMVTWSEHTGAVMNMEYMPKTDNELVSVSNYGEIILNKKTGTRLQSTILFNNSKYDFRDVIIDHNTHNIFAISRTGHLVIILDKDKSSKTLVLDKVNHPMRLHDLDEKNMLVIGESAVSLINLKNLTVGSSKNLPFHVMLGSRKEGLPLLFDDKGMMHLVRGFDKFETKKVPVEGKVTAYCESKNTGIEAYGMSDGSIWLIYKNGKKQKLIGHRSRISKMKLNGRRLFSSSYDGSVKLWMTDKDKVEPMTLAEIGHWIMHFNYDASKNSFWMGDAKGNLTALNISVPLMVETIRKKINRNLTRDEWNYFIGKDVPYETFVKSGGKEGLP